MSAERVVLDDALQIVERTGERWLEAELNRPVAAAAGIFQGRRGTVRKARSITEEQKANLWELRAAASLARLRGNQGRRAEARELLASVYGRFTEGFDMPDLREAKALLDELL